MRDDVQAVYWGQLRVAEMVFFLVEKKAASKVVVAVGWRASKMV